MILHTVFTAEVPTRLISGSAKFFKGLYEAENHLRLTREGSLRSPRNLLQI